MFTGLIEALGRVVELTPGRGSTRLAIASSLPSAEMKEGESVAVDGVCLTVSRLDEERFHADAIPETLSCTTLAGLRRDSEVNLERALRLGDRLGGHMVQGHVDGTARVQDLRRRGDDVRIRVALPGDLRKYVALKGSVALQGVSLTVSGLDAAGFEVALIPETLSRTTLGHLKAGDRVNVEVDLISRYLERLVDHPGDSTAGSVGRAARGS